MKENKYNPYISQKPTDGDSSTRAFKRRQWRNIWNEKFIAQDGKMNFQRDVRRIAWKLYWKQFNSTKNESVISNA